MKRNRGVKSVLISALVTLALAIPMVAADVTPVPATLSFEGASIKVLGEDANGEPNVQMRFSINVEYEAAGEGAGFTLLYNPTYFTPSNEKTNEPIGAEIGGTYTDAFFQYNKALYTPIVTKDNPAPVPENPFQINVTPGDTTGKLNYCKVNTSESAATMSVLLITKSNTVKPDPKKSILTQKKMGEGLDLANVFDSTPKSGVSRRVSLGTVSMKVNPAYLPQIVAHFQNHDGATPFYDVGGNVDFLFKTEPDWSIRYVGGTPGANVHMDHKADPQPDSPAGRLWYRYFFEKTMVSAAVTSPDVTVNAYEGYRTGKKADLPLTMQVYSPMATGYYSDGSSENFVIPWGAADRDFLAVQFGTEPAVPVTDANYTPTGGAYTLTQNQNLPYRTVDGLGDMVDKAFDAELTAKLTVTPITLVDVTAEQLTKTYLLSDSLLSRVRTGTDLKLPQEARLRTDIAPGGVSLTMPIPGWRPIKEGSAWPTTEMKVLVADESPVADVSDENCIRWPDIADQGALDPTLPNNVVDLRKGNYTFEMAERYGGAKTDFLKPDIVRAYPWMTVPLDTYALPLVLRRLVASGELIDSERYAVTYVSTVTDDHGNPKLTLDVKRYPLGGATTQESMEENSLFRVFLPDGTELGTGLTSSGAIGGLVSVADWFADQVTNFGSYVSEAVTTNGARGFALKTTPGITVGADAGTNAVQREELRRKINLGGWFFVSINENPTAYAWTDQIPVYVPPRENIYEEDKEYNFIKGNVGLFRSPGGIGTTVSMPHGSFHAVDATGDPLYVDNITGLETTSPVDAGKVQNPRKTLRYGVQTTYNGATGSEPGLLHTFSVKQWTKVVQDQIASRGPNEFKDWTVYSGYGPVLNRAIARPAPAADSKTTATLRTEEPEEAPQIEKVTLTCTTTEGITIGGDENVALATYDTRTEGYTNRQEYTFIITNVGTTTIYGLGLDTLTDVDSDGGHFVITAKPQAEFLAPGQYTTFTMTYVENLTTQVAESKTYRDKIFITSTSHPASTVQDALLHFDAELTVTQSELHNVTVKTVPENGTMGTANVIIGEYKDGGKPAMDYTAGSSKFKRDDWVYIVVNLVDEYTIAGITCKDESAAVIETHEYGNDPGFPAETAEIKKGTLVYCFKMPNYNTTITFTFEEGPMSKLRLSNLQAFSAAIPAELVANPEHPSRGGHEQYLWQKSFTQAEETAAAKWEEEGKGTVAGYFLMTGAAATKKFLSTAAQYLVVIPAPDDYSQVEATLRKVENHLALDVDPNIKPYVTMTLFTKQEILDKGVGTIVYSRTQGDTLTQSHHVSDTFPSPAKGESLFVRVDIDYKPAGASDTFTRSYYLELHRAPDEVIATFHYGNSPYGMIMNDPLIAGNDLAATAKAKTEAKASFRNNRYSFAGLLPAQIPSFVTAAGLAETHYWTEAWATKGALYEPESNTGAIYDPVTKTFYFDPAIYDEKNNRDLNDLSYFAVLTRPLHEPGVKEALDSSGRQIQVESITCSVKVNLLDTDATTQVGRFADPTDDTRIAVIDLGKNNQPVSAGWEKIRAQKVVDGVLQVDENGEPILEDKLVAIRPGNYELTYHIADYDGETVLTATRPMTIIAPLGDVNSDGVADKAAPGSDEAQVTGRVKTPLGYDATAYLDSNVFRYRSCDVNNDRNINNIDANRLRENPANLKTAYEPVYYRPVPPPAP